MKCDILVFIEILFRKFNFQKIGWLYTKTNTHLLIISRSFILTVIRNVSDKCCRENQKHTFYIQQLIFFLKSCRFWDHVRKYCRVGGRLQITLWHMRIACWIFKATNKTLRICNTVLITFPLQQWMLPGVSVLRYTCIACPVDLLTWLLKNCYILKRDSASWNYEGRTESHEQQLFVK